jgi:transcription elongation factor Elf1
VKNTIIERSVSCPFCAESMFILLDLSAGDQSYIEDCQVCCQPMQVSFTLLDSPDHGIAAETGNEDSISLQVECSA